MNIQEIVINQVCGEFEIDPNNHHQKFSVEELKDIIRYTTNKILMAHFQVLLENYLQYTDRNTALEELCILANMVYKNKINSIKDLSDFSEISTQIADIEVRFLEASLGLKT